jgi:hypothetical protein
MKLYRLLEHLNQFSPNDEVVIETYDFNVQFGPVEVIARPFGPHCVIRTQELPFPDDHPFQM